MKSRFLTLTVAPVRAQFKVFVLNTETGQEIGHIDENRQGYDVVGEEGYKRYPSRRISLFSDKYTGTFQTHEECVAFAKGVEAVINHVVSGAYSPP